MRLVPPNEPPAKDVDLVKAFRLCSECVREPILSATIRAKGTDEECHYCTESGTTLPLNELADLIEAAFERHYEEAPAEPDEWEQFRMNVSDFEWEQHGQPVVEVIAETAQIDREIAEDIRLVLADRHFDRRAYKEDTTGPYDKRVCYAEKDADGFEFNLSWKRFVLSVQTEARFFSSTAIHVLEELFQDLNILRTKSGEPVIAIAGPGRVFCEFYRSRVFQSEEYLKKALMSLVSELGPPTAKNARAGRMNALGISVFYGATKEEAALAEVRPPVGSRVLVGKFRLSEELHLLDLSKLNDAFVRGSIFDPEHAPRLARASFLRVVANRMSTPVMPDDEDFEYLVTQVIADFLASKKQVDGIIYPSPQSGIGGQNVVLFHHASRVSDLSFPGGSKIEADTSMPDDSGTVPWYQISIELPKETPKPPPQPSLGPLDLPPTDFDFDERSDDHRKPMLQLDVDSLSVHAVAKVEITTNRDDVIFTIR